MTGVLATSVCFPWPNISDTVIKTEKTALTIALASIDSFLSIGVVNMIIVVSTDSSSKVFQASVLIGGGISEGRRILGIDDELVPSHPQVVSPQHLEDSLLLLSLVGSEGAGKASPVSV